MPMTWEEIKKKRQLNNKKTSTMTTLTWDEIKRSRGYTPSPEPEPIRMQSPPLQSSREVFNWLEQNKGFQMPQPTVTRPETYEPAQITQPGKEPLDKGGQKTGTQTAPEANVPVLRNPTKAELARIKTRQTLQGIGDTIRSFTSGLSEGLGANVLTRLAENILFRWNKQANKQLPKGWSIEGDVEREYKELEPELKKQGYTDEQIKKSRKAALEYARVQDDEKAYREWMKKDSDWVPGKSDTTARTAGEITGSVGKFIIVDKILGPLVGSAGLPKSIENIVRNIGTGAITGAERAFGRGSDVGEIATEASRNALYMAAGGLASGVIGGAGGRLLAKTPLKDTIGGEIGLDVLRGIGFGAAGTAATLPTYPKEERPSGSEVLKNALVAGLFEGISSTLSTLAAATRNKAAMNKAMQLFETDIKGKYNVARMQATKNPAEALKQYASILDDIDASTQALKQNRYVGARDQVNKALELMENLKNYIQNEMRVVEGVAQGAAPGRFISEAASTPPAQSQSNVPNITALKEIPATISTQQRLSLPAAAAVSNVQQARPEPQNEISKLKSELQQFGTAKNGELQAKVLFHRTGEPIEPEGEPQGYYYLEYSTSDGKHEYGTEHFGTIEQAQDAALKDLINKDETLNRYFKKEPVVTDTAQVDVNKVPGVTAVTQTGVQDEKISAKRLEQIEKTKENLREAASNIELKEFNKNQRELYETFYDMPEDADLDDILDSLKIPTSVHKGFDYEQKYEFVTQLLKGYLGKEKLTDGNMIHIEIPRDGTFDIVNKPSKIAVVLDNLGIKIKKELPKGINQLVSGSNNPNTILDKDAILIDGYALFSISENQSQEIGKAFNVRKDDISKIKNTFFEFGKKATPENQVAAQPLNVISDVKLANGRKALKKGYLVFTTQDGKKHAFNKKAVDFMNRPGVTAHIIPYDKASLLIGMEGNNVVGVIISTPTYALNNSNINFTDASHFAPAKGYFNKQAKAKASAMAMSYDPNEPMPVPEKREKVLPWPENFPELINMTNLSSLKNEKNGNLELHNRAKAGDEKAAVELVYRVAKISVIKELGKRFPNAKIAYVHAEESTGKNKLPNAYAQFISEITGLDIAEPIIQINRAYRTSMSSEERLFQPIYFDGPVIGGQEYILVDDVITQGGTIRRLREYIESHGGKVVAVTTLSMGRGKSPKTIAIKKETVKALYEKFGRVNINTVLKEAGIANEAIELTQAEGLFILNNFRNADEIRSRSLEKRRDRIRQTNERNDKGKTERYEQISGEKTQSYAPQDQAASIPVSSGTSERSKTVDDIVEIIEKYTGVPIRTGRFRQRAYGIYKTQSSVIRTKVTNNLPVISHELGHHFDKLYGFSKSSQFDSELLSLGAATSRSGYSKEQIRAEGIAEFLRLYLTNPDGLLKKAPGFLGHFESKLSRDTLDFLNQLRYAISEYTHLPYNKRIYADISRGESRKSTKQTPQNVAHWFYDNWINDKGPFKRIQQLAEEAGYRGRNIDMATRTYSGLEAKIQNMFTDKQLDLKNNVVGPSLGEILDPITVKNIKKRGGDPIQEHQDFLSYLVSRRAVDYEERELNMPQPYYVYKANITAMEERYPHFKQVFEGLRKWEDNNLDLLVDSGILTKSDVEQIRKNNPNHMPLHRIMEAVETHKPGSGRTLGQSKRVIKKAIGSGKTIIDPLESIIADTYIIRRAAEANMILRDLKKAVETIDGFGDIMEAVPPGLKMTQFTVDEIKKQLIDMAEETQNEDLKKALESMTDEQMETSLKVFRPLFIGRDGDITIYENGKPHLYLVEPELYRAIKGLNRQASHFLIRALNIPKRVLQAGAVTTVDFMMRNMARDTLTSLIQSRAGLNPLDIFKGYVSAMLKDKHYREFIRHGGGTEVFNVNTRQDAQLTEDELLGYGYDIGTMIQRIFADFKELKFNNNERTRNKAWNSMKALLGLPFRTIRDAVGWSELGPRVAEFKKALKKGVNPETAAAWGRDLSVDFLQAGTLGREYNKITAFFNAWVQGNARLFETFKKYPLRTILRGLLYVTLPTLVNYFINISDDERRKAYEQLPEWRKALFWNVWIGKGKFIMVPKPHGYAWIFGSVPEIFLNKLLENNPDAWQNLWEQFVANFEVDVVPSAIAPVVEVAANKSWTGAPIESAADEQEFPYLRYDIKTSTLSKALGEISKDISPKKVDYLIKAYTGAVGDFLWRLPDIGKDLAMDPGDVTQYPIVKKFIVDAAYSNQSMDRFYTAGQEITRYVNEMKKGIPRAVKHLDKEKLAEAVTLMEQFQDAHNVLSKQFSEGRKAIRDLEKDKSLSIQQRKDAERAIKQGMNSVAYQFYQAYLEYKKKYKLK